MHERQMWGATQPVEICPCSMGGCFAYATEKLIIGTVCGTGKGPVWQLIEGWRGWNSAIVGWGG